MTKFTETGFARLDFDEAKDIARLVGFDVRDYASKKRSCGPGCDYLVQDKRYYVSMLLKHIERLTRDGRALPPAVQVWHEKARAAAEEYRDMEKRLYKIKPLS